jgi:hypothetical protein
MESHLVKVSRKLSVISCFSQFLACMRFSTHRNDILNRRNCVLFMRITSNSNYHLFEKVLKCLNFELIKLICIELSIGLGGVGRTPF